MKKSFYTVFPNCENIHLKKDVGMIPFLFSERGFNSYLVSYSSIDIERYYNRAIFFKNTKMKRYFGKSLIDTLVFIILNHRKIDVLNVYHFTYLQIMNCYIYKLLNRKGTSYLKLDTDRSIFENKVFYNNGIYYRIIRYLLSKIDIVSTETVEIYNFFDKQGYSNIIYVPNGYYDFIPPEPLSFTNKKDVILTVGRIGTKQKNTELLIRAFVESKKKGLNYKLYLVGPIEEEFKQFLSKTIVDNRLQDDIILFGPITDEKILKKIYDESKVFCLTSIFEGFPLVFPEALRSGNTIVTTNINSSLDVTNYRKNGYILDSFDIYELSDLLYEVCRNNKKLEENFVVNQQIAKERFEWSKIIDSLYFTILKDDQNF